MSRSALNRRRASSRARNDEARIGFQPSILATWWHQRLERDIKSGLWPGLHKGMLGLKIIFMGGKPLVKQRPGNVPAQSSFFSRAINAIGRKARGAMRGT